MTELNQVYKCSVCGNIVEVLHSGMGELVCCGQAMELQTEKTEEEKFEKHRPVVEKTATGITVKIGVVAHPMGAEHFIEWVEIITEKNMYRKYLSPGMAPEVEFLLSEECLEVRAYCNVHGLWKS